MFEGQYRPPVSPGDHVGTATLNGFKDLKIDRRNVTRSWVAPFGTKGTYVVPGYALEMIRGSYFATTNKDDMTNDQVYQELTAEFDLEYQGELTTSLVQEAPKAVRMLRLGALFLSYTDISG